MPELAQAADGLHPAEDLFHEFSFPLTHVIARRGPTVDRTPADLLRHVGRDVLDAHVGNEARHIVALVRPDRAARRSTAASRFGGTDGDKPLSIVQQTWPDTPAWCPSDTTCAPIGRRLIIAPPGPTRSQPPRSRSFFAIFSPTNHWKNESHPENRLTGSRHLCEEGYRFRENRTLVT